MTLRSLGTRVIGLPAAFGAAKAANKHARRRSAITDELPWRFWTSSGSALASGVSVNPAARSSAWALVGEGVLASECRAIAAEIGRWASRSSDALHAASELRIRHDGWSRLVAH